jgi:hypothetical protein
LESVFCAGSAIIPVWVFIRIDYLWRIVKEPFLPLVCKPIAVAVFKFRHIAERIFCEANIEIAVRNGILCAS